MNREIHVAVGTNRPVEPVDRIEFEETIANGTSMI